MRIIAAISLLLAGWTTALSQDSNPVLSGRLNKAKRAVYMEVDCQSDAAIRLRLRNNTPWALAIPTYSLYLNPKNVVTLRLRNGTTVFPLPNDKEISSVYYFVESDPAFQKIDVPQLNYPDSFNESWLASNDSIRFSVSKLHLRDGLQIYISFNYEWELGEQGIIHNDVGHKVVFRSVELSTRGATVPCR